MQEDILINWAAHETRVAVVEAGVVQELHIERTNVQSLVGNVYLGKVTRVLPGMQSAFVDIGLDKAAFLHVADVWRRPPLGETISMARAQAPAVPIEKQVFEGQSLLVQAIKDPLGSKGARLTTQISIAGRLLVFLPQDDHIGVSQKIDAQQRESLRQRMQGLAQPEGGGFILRTNAEDAADDALAEDIAYLRRVWKQIQARSLQLPAASLVHQELSLSQRVLRDLVRASTGTIWIDAVAQYESLSQFASVLMPGAAARLKLYEGQVSLFELHAVEAEIAKALARRVDLACGGYLVIDQTEAMATVDVNTGGFIGVRDFEETVFKTNLEAAKAIARQLRLRNLGGIILVDFIDMAKDEHRQSVLSEMRRLLARDSVRTMCGDYSQLGLLELTRKRTRESLAHLLCEPCPTCEGRGTLKSARSVAYDILREIARQAAKLRAREFRVLACPDVIELLRGEEAGHLSDVLAQIATPVTLYSESGVARASFEIVTRE